MGSESARICWIRYDHVSNGAVHIQELDVLLERNSASYSIGVLIWFAKSMELGLPVARQSLNARCSHGAQDKRGQMASVL